LSLKRLLPLLLLALPLLAQQPGQITERVVTARDPQQSYALYLPSGYTPNKAWPVIFAFDPEARGVEGVKAFREAAEKYGYIVAASNNSRNGALRPQVDAAVAMMGDVQQRFSLDTQRIYAAGFSGGARMAGLAGFLCHNCVRAVIACGAGFPENLTAEQKNLLPAYFFSVGQYDFNYFDVLDAARSLRAPATVAIFDGSHQWAPPDIAMQAVAWTAAGASTRNVPPATPEEAKQRRRESDLVGHLVKQLNTARNETEDREQNFADAGHEVAALRKKREQATGEDLIVYRRALGTVFIHAYESSQRLMEAGKPELAASFLEVAGAAIAPNPDLTYETASAWAAAGDKKKALVLLKQSVALGFHDTQALAADKHFDPLRSSSDFQAIFATMR